MSKIEELPDNYGFLSTPKDDIQDLKFLTPTLPPNMASVKGQTVDEVAAELKRSPFFMTSLDDALDEDNTELEAMRALMYEGTRVENAEGFREQGNEMAKAKNWADAREFYYKGLLALRVETKEGDAKGGEEDKKEMVVKEACLINRALCNLELKNYRSCCQDCNAALILNPTNVKAYYRLSQAFLALQKLPEALEACSTGLTVSPTNTALQTLLKNIKTKKASQDVIEQKRIDREVRAKNEKILLKAALKARMIRLRNTGQPPEMEDAAMRLVPDPLSPTSTLTFPVVFLYPLHLQSDFIKAFGEEQTLLSHLEYLLPLPWDQKTEYTVNDVDAYMQTVDGGLIKWGKKVPLLKVLSGGKVEVVDGIVKINIIPKSQASGWIELVKKQRAAK